MTPSRLRDVSRAASNVEGSTGLLKRLRESYHERRSPEISERLFISVNTVKKYLSRVYAKVEVEHARISPHRSPAVTCSTP